MEQHLIGTTKISMFVNTTGFGIAQGQALQGSQQRLSVVEHEKNNRDKFSKYQNCFEQAAIGIVPKIK
jgi:hypothetical protein